MRDREPEGLFRDLPAPRTRGPFDDLKPDYVPASDRQLFELTVRAEPGEDEIKALRALLKSMLRRFGLRCINIVPRKPGP